MSLNCSTTQEIQKNGWNQNANSIWTIIFILNGCNLFTHYLKNGKIPLKIKEYLKTFFFLNHHLIKSNILLSLEKLNSKELYLIQLTHDLCTSISQIYFEKHFNDCVLDWKYIYVLPRIVTSDPYTRYFRCKVLNNVLYLNEKLFFYIAETFQCSFCNQNNETIEHLFCQCFVAKALWNGLNTFFENHFSL